MLFEDAKMLDVWQVVCMHKDAVNIGESVVLTLGPGGVLSVTFS
jgi:hypothetical protein